MSVGAEFVCACGCHRDPPAATHPAGCPCATVGPSSCLACRQGLHAHDLYAYQIGARIRVELYCPARRRQEVDELRRRTAGTRQAAAEYRDSLPVRAAIADARRRRERHALANLAAG